MDTFVATRTASGGPWPAASQNWQRAPAISARRRFEQVAKVLRGNTVTQPGESVGGQAASLLYGHQAVARCLIVPSFGGRRAMLEALIWPSSWRLGTNQLGRPAHLWGMTMAASQQDPLLSAVAHAAAGDEMAFARIVAAHHDDMSRVAYVVCRDIELAQDAVQQAWTIAWRQLPKLRDPERLRSWLVSIAANEARQIMRRNRRRSVVELDLDAAASSGTTAADWGANIDLRNALGRLSPEDRALLAMRYIAGMDSTELSQYTRLSPSGTRARLARLLSTLRAELHDV
jgi:RNA polymerase sigma factor (sigma-70 family)